MNRPHTPGLWLAAALGLADLDAAFPWQRRLLATLMQGQLPASLDIPTGLGKTSVMAIWLVARALGAAVPRRLVYVVDRRAVVDQATTAAEQLRHWVDGDPAIRQGLGLTQTLPISTLRGQHADNREWLADPTLPAIVLGTVDMIGSRLLFSGYGVSRRMQPYHAGLLGSDTLLVLDEAHLVPPFERLLQQLASGVDADGRRLRPDALEQASLIPPLRLMSLSATAGPSAPSAAFKLDDDDRAHPVVKQRLFSVKRLAIRPEAATKELADRLAEEAWLLAEQGSLATRIIVFVNSRADARKVQFTLDKLVGKPGQTDLFVGGRRVHERKEAADRLTALGFVAGSDRSSRCPVFLIATSAGEVGVDLDADHAVCDLVAWERMVQRLGRVNRRGSGDSMVVVVPSATDDDRVSALRTAVLEALQGLPRLTDGLLDACPAALTAMKSNEAWSSKIERASTPAPLHPPLSKALVDAWAMTSLDEHSGRPEVQPWIRGWPDVAEQPQTTIIWRRFLPVSLSGQLLPKPDLDLFWEAAGPHLSETLEADAPEVADWLLQRAASALSAAKNVNDGEGDTARLQRSDPVAVVTNPSAGTIQLYHLDALTSSAKRELERRLRGAQLLVDCRLGGLASGLLSVESDEPAQDVSELGSNADPGPVPFRVSRASDLTLVGPQDGWRLEASIPLNQTDEGVTTWLMIHSPATKAANSEEGRTGSMKLQSLKEHQQWTEASARDIAAALGLPAIYRDMLAIAARLHDEGKRELRWQRAFHAPQGGSSPYAKTVGRPDLALLDGYRHEFGSLPYAEADTQWMTLPPELRALCLHLIAAHHGAARPVIRTSGAPEPPSRAASRAREIALRYAELSTVWGHWGLAWWESLLRSADQQASRRNDDKGAFRG